MTNPQPEYDPEDEAAVDALLDQIPDEMTCRLNRYAELLAGDDIVALFCAGGCHAFALELNARYGYPLRVFERATGGIAHVFCLRDGVELDVRGRISKKIFFERFFNHAPDDPTPRDITRDELLAMVPGTNWQLPNRGKFGLWDEPSFFAGARARAKAVIEDDAQRGDASVFSPGRIGLP